MDRSRWSLLTAKSDTLVGVRDGDRPVVPATPPPSDDAWQHLAYCPNCSTTLQLLKCKARCPHCGFFQDCSDTIV